MQFAGNGGTLFHDNQLLLALLMPVERQSRGKLFNQRVHQLLLIVAEMASIGQRRQQNTVLGVRVGEPPF
ncbi:Uncharacterised protein [Salmonella enterica subsp. enterica serovar Bovismorbificans]|uniref:Uncharacterized protein n=2 Tax=Salmonella enterica I TaxID=59201 RepID=A0A655E1S2_SALET|nr:hypothetical protein LTSEALA_2044 [Salmonella enterica subsp. enterica serovar Alachua str. R6-377]CNU96691.1 Uncharacterised protein [Salmonella enterica subsp. enterica serovar Bovismorbificans]CQC00507.1 Uncharacterised protein [Salmonella enterica subsp. enterica serovar Typhimurium str. DT104]CQN90441.1 Uncharacterised protein [Salmonella enterica subsp. enterica serovar Typhimurium str. DT104]VFS85345.1 Uncharacterised protein [Salmonella enterica subsp. enterica]